jgi:hypothetical protein
MMMLAPEKARGVLEDRAVVLRRDRAALDEDLSTNAASLPRVTLLETEYLQALTAAELGWVEAVIDDLKTGTLSWSYEELAAAVVDDAE